MNTTEKYKKLKLKAKSIINKHQERQQILTENGNNKNSKCQRNKHKLNSQVQIGKFKNGGTYITHHKQSTINCQNILNDGNWRTVRCSTFEFNINKII